jgi:aminocarboxymuconate-semialdehyde decarboxylase
MVVPTIPPSTVPASDAYGSLGLAKAHLNQIGADGAVFSIQNSWFRYRQDLVRQTALNQLLNNELRRWTKDEPMIKGMAALPLPYGPEAADELSRTTEMGLVGAMIGSNLNGMFSDNLDDKALEPLWARAEQLGAPMFIHPTGTFAGAERLTKWGLNASLGNAIETTIAVMSLLNAGVLDRYPHPKIVPEEPLLRHAGVQAGRADVRRGHGGRRPDRPWDGLAVQEPDAGGHGQVGQRYQAAPVGEERDVRRRCQALRLRLTSSGASVVD